MYLYINLSVHFHISSYIKITTNALILNIHT